MLINCVLSATGGGSQFPFRPSPVVLTALLSLALHVYDRILTLGQEIDFIWRRKDTKFIVPVLYLTMHTSASLFLLLAILPDAPGCQASSLIRELPQSHSQLLFSPAEVGVIIFACHTTQCDSTP